ncbi:hypothetical protein BDF19DRAFT_437017 [Syncephalis fuscata]|nr:hypothetical protein BDF19DRAFT_437017 [Syncephalis fuscata]
MPLKDNLQDNATTWFGIPLNPLGGIPVYDFVAGKDEDYELPRSMVQARLTGLQRQIACYMIMSLIFVRNTVVAINVLKCQPKSFSGWCCLMASLFGICMGMMDLVAVIMTSLNCRQIVWFIILVYNCSIMFNTIILLHKAYLALLRRRWVLFVGAFFIILQLLFAFISVQKSPITIEAYNGCVINYTVPTITTWIVSVLPVNMLLSGIFSYIAYRQYRLFGSTAWKKLAEDGIQTMCVVILCNILCGIVIVFKLFGNFSELFFMIDWVVTSTILANHCDFVCRTVKSLSTASGESKSVATTNMDIKENTTIYPSHAFDTTNYTLSY